MESIDSAEHEIDAPRAFDRSAFSSGRYLEGAHAIEGELPDDAGDEGSVLERGRQMLAGAEAKLAGVERALARLDAGNYGLCEVCGAPIAAAVLAEYPSLARCSEHDERDATAS